MSGSSINFNDDSMLWIVLGIAALLVYFKLNKPLTKDATTAALQNAGFKTYSTPSGTFAQTQAAFGGENTTFKVPEEGWPLNFAQKTLIGIDRFIPGTWLTRMALT